MRLWLVLVSFAATIVLGRRNPVPSWSIDVRKVANQPNVEIPQGRYLIQSVSTGYYLTYRNSMKKTYHQHAWSGIGRGMATGALASFLGFTTAAITWPYLLVAGTIGFVTGSLISIPFYHFIVKETAELNRKSFAYFDVQHVRNHSQKHAFRLKTFQKVKESRNSDKYLSLRKIKAEEEAVIMIAKEVQGSNDEYYIQLQTTDGIDKWMVVGPRRWFDTKRRKLRWKAHKLSQWKLIPVIEEIG